MYQIYIDDKLFGPEHKTWEDAADYAARNDLGKRVRLGSHIKTLKFYSDVNGKIMRV